MYEEGVDTDLVRELRIAQQEIEHGDNEQKGQGCTATDLHLDSPFL